MRNTPRTTLGQRAFTLLLWGLAFHIAAIALLYGAVGVNESTLRLLAAWKEVMVVVVLAYVCLRATTGRGVGTTICAVDVLVALLIGLALVFVIGGSTIVDGGVALSAQLLGFRDALFFLLLYVVGRATPEIADDPRTLRRIVAVGVVTSCIAIGEIVYVQPDLLATIGVGRYFQDFLNIGETTVGNNYGLPDNYWSMLGGHVVRRAGSVYLSSQGFAIPFLVILPAAMWLLLTRETHRVRAAAACAIVWSGLLLSITRMTIVAGVVQLITALALRRRFGLVVTAVWTAIGTLAVAMLAVPTIAMFVWQTLSGQTGSNVSHAKDVANGVAAMVERPWGWGLGTADQTALRNNLVPLTADNLYLKYGAELGGVGLGLAIALLIAIGAAAYQLYARSDDVRHQAFGAVVFLATVGIVLNGNTSFVFYSPWLAYIYFWMAGTVVTLWRRLPARDFTTAFALSHQLAA